MKKVIVFVVLLLCTFSLLATDWCVRDTASGTNNGTDWTNAWEDMDDIVWGGAGVARGDTVYIADGAYLGDTFGLAVSGSTYIYIKKAIISDHGIATGWDNAYGDGSAVFGAALTFTTNYWEFNGQTRGSDWVSNYGFRVDYNPSGGNMVTLNERNYIKLKYTEIDGTGDATAGADCYYMNSALSSSVYNDVQYCYMHSIARCHILSRNMSNCLFEYNYFKHNGIETVSHPEVISSYGVTVASYTNDDNIFRFNIMDDCVGSGLVLWGGDGWELYGNVAWWTDTHPTRTVQMSDGVFGNWLGKAQAQFGSSNCKIYNNTFVDLESVSNVGIPFYSGESGNVVYNNIWCGWTGSLTFFGAQTHDYNAFSDADNRSEANAQTNFGTGNFTNYASQDFTLANATDAGTTLGSPYNVDMDGVTRGAVGVWDRGAYEYGSGGDPPGSPLASNLTMLMAQIQIMPIFWGWYALVCFVVIRLINKS